MLTSNRRTNRQKKPHGADAAKQAQHASNTTPTGTEEVSPEAAGEPTSSSGTASAPGGLVQGTLAIDGGPGSEVVASTAPADTLPKLAEQIRQAIAETQEHIHRFRTAVQVAAEHAMKVGQLLIRAKGLLPHGEWEPWLAENAPGLSPRTARRWMSGAKRPPMADLATGDRAMSPQEAIRFLTHSPDRVKAKRPAAKEKTRTVSHDEVHRESDLDAGDDDDDDEESINQDATDDQESEEPASGKPERNIPDALLQTSTTLAKQLADARKQGVELSPEHLDNLRRAQGEMRSILGEEDPGDGHTPADENEIDAPTRMTLDELVEDFVDACVDLRDKADRILQPCVKLVPRQSREVFATAVKLQGICEKLGGAEGKTLCDQARGKRG